MITKKKKLAEGFSPIYDKSGKITPKTKNLGPEYLKDLKLKIMKEKITPKKKPKEYKQDIKNIKNLA